MVERFHRRLKESLIALGAEDPEEWFWKLPLVMLSIRTTLKPDLGASPADLVYGEGLAVPGELLPSSPATDAQLLRQREAALADLRLEVARLQPVQTSAHRHPLIHLPEDLETCTHVFIRRGSNGLKAALASPYIGPFRVVARNSLNFKVTIPGRADETVSISRIKPAYCSIEDAEGAEPPARPPGPRPQHPRQQPRRRPRRSRASSEGEGPQSPPIRTGLPPGPRPQHPRQQPQRRP